MNSKIKSFTIILIIVLSVLGLNGERNETLRSYFSDIFYIGAAVAAGEWGGNNSFVRAGDRVLSEFSSVTAGNCMKPDLIQPRQGSFKWGPADLVVNNAQRLDMVVRGHVLVWHNQTPNWMYSGGKDRAGKNLQNHITTIVGRYRGRIYAWDVVNEAISDGQGTYRKDSPWYKAYGDETYIVDAFDFARSADPNAQLIYNDYNLVLSEKRNKTVRMIKTLKLKEHGLTGVGIQAHWNLVWPSTSEIQKTIDTFARMGLDIQITELDIDCYSNGTEAQKPYNYTIEKRLAKRYNDIFIVLKKNSNKISSVTFWGVCDDDSWLNTFNGNTGAIPYRENYPLLFDKNRQKKKAYYEIID